MNEPYLLALGYGGDREASAWFEWNFRCRIGAENPANEAEREVFIRSFVQGTENGQEYAIPLDETNASLVQTFGEYAKVALAEHRDLFVFYVLEDTSTAQQYRIYLKQDEPGDEMLPSQIYCDGFEVPREALIWMQQVTGCRFYVTEDRTEMMLEFPYQGPEELPVIM